MCTPHTVQKERESCGKYINMVSPRLIKFRELWRLVRRFPTQVTVTVVLQLVFEMQVDSLQHIHWGS